MVQRCSGRRRGIARAGQRLVECGLHRRSAKEGAIEPRSESDGTIIVERTCEADGAGHLLGERSGHTVTFACTDDDQTQFGIEGSQQVYERGPW